MNGWWFPVGLFVVTVAFVIATIGREQWREYRAGAERAIEDEQTAYEDEALALLDELPLVVDPAPTLREETLPLQEWVSVGARSVVHRRCRDMRRDGQPHEMCDGCAARLGRQATTPRRTV